MDALPFLSASNAKRQPVYALLGDEDFLKRLVRERIIAHVLGEADPAFAVSTYAGDKLEYSTVRNELDTLPFLSPCRIVVVENGDAFVSTHRQSLEQYVAKPSSVGVLILDVKVFADNTKLAKSMPDAAKIACKAPPPYKLPAWCVDWAKTHHKKKLTPDASELLVELVGAGMGQLDQELGKLASAVGAKLAIAAEDVEMFVGRSKAADVWRIMDAVGEGRPGEALGVLEDLFAEGEDPMGVLGPLTSQLRKLATVARLHLVDGLALGPAIDAVGIPRVWERRRLSFERQLKHLGRRRLEKLTEWLTEINIGMKGGNPLPERVQVERLVVMLARPREEAKK
jgi:DNA polymerase-3 subunit delta